MLTRYYIETKTTNDRKMYYNFTRAVWQHKLTDHCMTVDKKLADYILSLRLLTELDITLHVKVN